MQVFVCDYVMSFKQLTFDQEGLGILPNQRSSRLETSTRELKPKPYFVMKKLSKKAKEWLENSLTTNWSQVISKQNYTTKKKFSKF